MNRRSTGIIIGIALLVGVALALQAANIRLAGYDNGYRPAQPIAFSHALHAGTNQIDCQYCHSTADEGPHAGIPPANVCMNCHTWILPDSPEIAKIKFAVETDTPIQWLRVHSLPDFVNFNHSRHVSGGVACQSCHGAVETMAEVEQVNSLSMGWCVSCHRRSGVAGSAAGTSPFGPPATDCSACHH